MAGKNKTLSLYYSAIACYEEVEAFFHRENIDIPRIREGIKQCYQKIDNIILAEDQRNSYLVHLFQLKHHMIQLLKFLDNSPKLNKVKSEPCSRSKEDNQALKSIVENALETPRIKGFKEVAGLWEVKKILKSLVILPKTQPQLFKDRKLLNSLLLFGPPGTGKTHLVHALAFELQADLFSITAGNIMSAYVGDSEKNIKFLFDYLKTKETFSLLFIDEVDGFCRQRSNTEQDHSRRLKTELLCQISQMESQPNFFLICATNCPWDLDTAFLRRFQKRLYIPLPNHAERCDLLTTFTVNTPLEKTFASWEQLIHKTEGWSGSDLSNLVQQALNIPIIELEDTKIWKDCSDGFFAPVNVTEIFNLEEVHCSELRYLPPGSVRARNVEPSDLLTAFEQINVSVTKSEVQKFEDFCKKNC